MFPGVTSFVCNSCCTVSVPQWSIDGGANWSNTKPARVHSVAVIGGGVMGIGICVSFLRKAYPVYLIEKDDQVLETAMQNIKSLLGKQSLGDCFANLHPISNMNQLPAVDLVVEAVYESLDLKKQLFSSLHQVCPPATILASNTSTLSIDKIAAATERADKVAGMHFFNPADLQKTVELIYGQLTSPQTVATLVEVSRDIGKVPVVMRNCAGFVGNRMCFHYFREATKLVEQNMMPEEVDHIFTQFGFVIGPFKSMDLIGLDTIERISGENGLPVSPLVKWLCDKQRFGRKNGKGWYVYLSNGQRKCDGEVDQFVASKHSRAGAEKPSSEEVVKCCLYPLLNEGFKIVEERIVDQPQHIDIIWLSGYGWPVATGGPMHWAVCEQRLPDIHQHILKRHLQEPNSNPAPSNLLEQLAAQPDKIDANWLIQSTFASKL